MNASSRRPTLDVAKRLAEERDWRALAGLGDGLAAEALEGTPELAYLVGDARRRMGALESALVLGRIAEKGAREMGDRRLVLRVTNLLGMIHFESGRVEAAEDAFQRLLERASEEGEDELAARASNNLGVIANVQGRTELALTAYQRALAAYHRLGYQRGLAQTHYNLGLSYRDLGFPSEADAHYTLAIRHAEAADTEDVVALAETERALLRVHAGDGDLAASIASRALARCERIGDQAAAANALRVIAAAARAAGRAPVAVSHLEDALERLATHPDPFVLAEVQRDRGLLLIERGDDVAGRDALGEALASFERLGATRECEAIRVLLQPPLPQGDPM